MDENGDDGGGLGMWQG